MVSRIFIEEGDNMKVGSLVRARHWSKEYIAIVVSIRNDTDICKVMMQDGCYLNQLISDLEVLA